MVTDCQVRKLMKLLNEEQTLCSALTMRELCLRNSGSNSSTHTG